MNAELVVGFPDDAISFGDTPAVAVVGGGGARCSWGSQCNAWWYAWWVTVNVMTDDVVWLIIVQLVCVSNNKLSTHCTAPSVDHQCHHSDTVDHPSRNAFG